ncbi:hypothetical protein [Pararhodonellum marinum]|uniref:hypothetical protein n=1 Tax=Pararhodonellum marinum TaxID=2755358 RepID=UPI0018905482|nr:hypothetical protein [Pararhodonellum marinum]
MKSFINTFLLKVIFVAVLLLGTACEKSQVEDKQDKPVQPFPENPFYWSYKGEPILLLGGTWQDNLFNHPEGLEGHLELLMSVGGNYVRNTMSHRNVGNVFAYAKTAEGYFDLDKFNEAYWDRFATFLKICHDKDIIVQLEIWDPWDHYEDHQSFGGWSHHPFNPVNTMTFTPETSRLPIAVDYPPRSEPSEHAFFRTVPDLDNNEMVLSYQQAYVDQLLSISLPFPNVIYCINNESGEELAWSNYWAAYLHQKGQEKGVKVQVTEMRRREDVQAADHRLVFDDPQHYTFVDISQNNAFSGLGQRHYDNIQYVRDYLSQNPRPINNIKNYGAARHGEEESIARFCRMVFAGAASARFHRPHPLEDPKDHEAATDFGLGLSPKAQRVIQSMRQVSDKLALTKANPRNDLLSEREENEAYLLAEEGKQYAIYFPLDAGDGQVLLDMNGAKGKWQIAWVNVSENTWLDTIEEVEINGKAPIQKPERGHWACVILPSE